MKAPRAIALATALFAILSLAHFRPAAADDFSSRVTKLDNYISVSIREGEFADAANGMIELGNLYSDYGLGAKAFASYKKAYDSAVRQLEDEGDDPEYFDIASTAAGLAAQSLNADGARDDALRWLGFAEKYARPLNDIGCIARIHNDRGAVYDSMGDYRDALRDYFDALDKSATPSPSTCDKLLVQSSALNNIGLLYLSQGNTAKASDFLSRALELDEKSGDPRRLAITKNNLCLNTASAGDSAAAAECYNAAAELFISAGDSSGAALAQINRADSLVSTGAATDAVSILEKLVSAKPPLPPILRAASLHNLAAAELRLGRVDGALSHITAAISIKDEYESLDYASLALQGEILHALGKRADARKALDDAIKRIETRRVLAAGSREEQARAFSRMAHVYREMILLLLETDDVEGALRYYEMMKARTLKEMIDGGLPSWDKWLTPEEEARKKELETKMADANRRMGAAATLLAAAAEDPSGQRSARADLLDSKKLSGEAAEEYSIFMDTLFSAHPGLAENTGNYNPAPLKQIRASLSPDEIAACFLPSGGEITVLLVSSGVMRFKRIPIEGDTLRKSFDALSRWKKNPENRQLFDSAIEKLSSLLIDPIADDIAPYSKITVIPDSFLWEIPFQALHHNGKVLIDTHEVGYAMSLEALRAPAAAPPATGGIYAFGDAIYLGECPQGKCARGGGDDDTKPEWMRADLSRFGLLTRIPGTGDEVASIKEVFPSSKTFIGLDASEHNFLSSYADAGILHFAAHGIYNPRDPMGSAIALTQVRLGEGEDGFVQAREVAQLHIPARLVVLSACESARSETLEGEGMTGLAWSFFSAGADGVVASQWYVSDYSTALTMKKFYEGLNAGKSPASALRDAQLAVLHDDSAGLSAPFHWAPFIYIRSFR